MAAPTAISVPNPLALSSWTACRCALIGIEDVEATIEAALIEGETVDGLTLVAGDRVLVVPTGSTNVFAGIWVSHAATPTRATDADEAAEFTRHKTVAITAGDDNAGRTFRYDGAASPTVDTDALLFIAGPAAIAIPS